mgnify:CR=1 FL=1
MKSKRFEVLAARPVNQDGYVQEWPEVGLIAMNSPFDPKPSIKIENGVITEMDGKCRADFDMLDTFIADHAIRLGNAEKAMAMDSLEIARKIGLPEDIIRAASEKAGSDHINIEKSCARSPATSITGSRSAIASV